MDDIFLGALELTALTVASVEFNKLQKRQQVLKNLIRFIQKAPVLSVSELKKTLGSQGNFESLSETIQGFEDTETYSRGWGLVQGIVKSTNTMRSQLNNYTPLVLSLVSSEQMFSNSKNFEETEGSLQSRCISEFALAENNQSSKQLTIGNFHSVDAKSAVNTIHSIEHTRDLTPSEHLINWLLFCIRLFLSMSNVSKKLSGFKIGTRRVERGIVLGQYLIAFGEIIYNKFTKEMRIDRPKFFMQDKDQYLRHLRDKNTKIGRNTTLWLILAVVPCILLLKRIFKVTKKLIEKYRKHTILKKIDPLYRIKSLFTDSFKCKICQKNPRSVIFQPCLHLLICTHCANKMADQHCPDCGQEIIESVSLFVS